MINIKTIFLHLNLHIRGLKPRRQVSFGQVLQSEFLDQRILCMSHRTVQDSDLNHLFASVPLLVKVGDGSVDADTERDAWLSLCRQTKAPRLRERGIINSVFTKTTSWGKFFCNSIWNKIPSYFKTITDPLNHLGVQDIGQGTNQTPQNTQRYLPSEGSQT